MSSLRVSEIFATFQGEGKLAGTPSVFIRLSFCNLRCGWCDTPYTSWAPEYQQITSEQVRRRVEELMQTTRYSHLVITGGEPLLQAGALRPLCAGWRQVGLHLTLETNGTLECDLDIDFLSVSPKLLNSVPAENESVPLDVATAHNKSRINVPALRYLLATYTVENRDCQFKFVVESEKDLTEIAEVCAAAGIPSDRVWLMPQVTDRTLVQASYDRVRSLCTRTGYSFSPRLHIELFGNRRAT